MFYVLCKTVISQSIEDSIFPNEFKLDRLAPILKSGVPSIWNYRPISVLSFFSKIYEFININTIINTYQFGFRQRHSSQQASIILVNIITSCIDSGDLMIGVFLDMKKNHLIL